MSKFIYKKSKLTWDEIHAIEKEYKPISRGAPEGFPAGKEIQRLIGHIRFLEYEHSRKEPVYPKLQHFCPDWDFLELKPGHREMDYCTCDFSPKVLWDQIGVLTERINKMAGDEDDDTREQKSSDSKVP